MRIFKSETLRMIGRVGLLFVFILSGSIESGFAGGVGSRGGADFEYMRSLSALSEKDFTKILEAHGTNFMESVVTPTSWLGLQYALRTPIEKFAKFDEPSRKIWRALLGEGGLYGYETLWTNVNSTRLENCSCDQVVEKESRNNQMCAFSASGREPAKICVDLARVFDPARPANASYSEFLGQIWHELAHLYGGIHSRDHESIYAFQAKVERQLFLAQPFVVASPREKTVQKCGLNGKTAKVASAEECVSAALALSFAGPVKLKYTSPNRGYAWETKSFNAFDRNNFGVYYKTLHDHTEMKGRFSAGSEWNPHAPVECVLTKMGDSFLNEMITERTVDFLVRSGSTQEFPKWISSSVGELSVWSVSIPAWSVSTCLYAFSQGFTGLRVNQGAQTVFDVQADVFPE